MKLQELEVLAIVEALRDEPEAKSMYVELEWQGYNRASRSTCCQVCNGLQLTGHIQGCSTAHILKLLGHEVRYR